MLLTPATPGTARRVLAGSQPPRASAPSLGSRHRLRAHSLGPSRARNRVCHLLGSRQRFCRYLFARVARRNRGHERARCRSSNKRGRRVECDRSPKGARATPDLDLRHRHRPVGVRTSVGRNGTFLSNAPRRSDPDADWHRLRLSVRHGHALQSRADQPPGIVHGGSAHLRRRLAGRLPARGGGGHGPPRPRRSVRCWREFSSWPRCSSRPRWKSTLRVAPLR
jgi:hypothetical protein